MLRQYIDRDLAIPPNVPATFGDMLAAAVFFNISVITQTAPAFFALLTSAPTLFANISLAVDVASDQIVIPPAFFDDNANVTAAVDSLNALVADFVAIANDSCDISLSQQQIDDVTRLFDVILPTFFILSVECELLNQTLVEQAVAAADADIEARNLADRLNQVVDTALLHADRLFAAIGQYVMQNPVDDMSAAAQTVRDEFLLIINDFCGIPPLSNTTLTQLDEYFTDLANGDYYYFSYNGVK